MPVITTGDIGGWQQDGQFNVSDPDGTYAQSAVTLNYLLYTTILPGIPFKYASVSAVDMKTTGQTTLFTVPNTPITSGYKFIVTNILVKPSAISAYLTDPIIRIGKSASYNEYLGPTTVSGLDAVGKYKFLQDYNYGSTVGQMFNLGDTIKLDITTAATGTTVQWDFILFGIFV